MVVKVKLDNVYYNNWLNYPLLEKGELLFSYRVYRNEDEYDEF